MAHKKIRIGVDVDGVLRCMDSFVEIMRRAYPDAVKSNVVSGWDYPNIDLPWEIKAECMFHRFPKEVFYDSLPYPEAKKDFPKLMRWADLNNAFLVCVSHQKPHLIHYTYSWLANHNFIFNELHFTENKHEIDIDYLIDDSPRNYEAWVSSGRSPETYFLFDRDYNKDIDAPLRVKRLYDVVKFFEKSPIL